MQMDNELTFYSLGGIGDVTKNMYVYETPKDMIIVDCGIGFPDENMPGVDLVLPDISAVLEKKEKLRGIMVTHAHEDHLGALPYLWPKLNVPIFSTKLTAAFIEYKLTDNSLKAPIFIKEYREKFTLGDFEMEFVRINHSVPNAANLYIKTPAGNFYHGSDFKFDLTPLDDKTADFGRIATIGEEGVTCLMSDSLRSEKEGFTLSEKTIEVQLEKEIEKCSGKFIVTAHSSDLYRWQMVVNVAKRNQRKLFLVGRSVEQAINIGRKFGYLDIDDHMILDTKAMKNYPPRFVCVLAAGSQGQPFSAMSRIANGEHQHVKIKSGDTVVFSADPIPGNENLVHGCIDSLTKLGATVFYSEVDDALHVSGHAASGEMMLLMALIKPRFLIPIGGTFRHMKRYADLALKMGYQKEDVLLLETGQKVIFNNKKYTLGKKIELKNILIDGLGIGDIGNIVLRDRQQMSSDGIVIAILPIETSSGTIFGQPEIISRGFVYMKESDKLIREAQDIIRNSLSKNQGRISDWSFLRTNVESRLTKFLFDKTARRPMVLSVIVEV